MSVIVTNMDMPYKCLNCRMQYRQPNEFRNSLTQPYVYFCAALGKFIGYELYTDKRPDCPLRDMPDKDGEKCSGN